MDNQLYCGDNLVILRYNIKPASIDLCYCDPPFNSKRDYYGRSKESDILSGDIDSNNEYLGFSDRFLWDAKTENIAQEIISGKGEFYSLLPVPTQYLLAGLVQSLPRTELLAYLLHMTPRILAIYTCLHKNGSFFLHADANSIHYLKIICDSIFLPKGGKFVNQLIWHYKTGGTSKRWFSKKHDVILYYSKSSDYVFNISYQKSYLSHRYGFKNITIHQDKDGYYTNIVTRDVWDIPALRGNQSETLGYPTQKPELLLERIISASSLENQMVLDAYCGSGTTLAVSQRLNRHWIGIDINPKAIELTAKRLNHHQSTIYV